MVADDCAAELGNVVLEVDEVFALLVSCNIIEVNVLVAPLEVMNDALVGELLFDDEDILEEIDDALFDVKVVELGDHRLLVLEVLLVHVNESIALVNDVADIVEDSAVVAHVHLLQLFGQVLILFFLALELSVHVFDLMIVPLQLTHNQFLVHASELC